MPDFELYYLAAAGSTGNNTHNAVYLGSGYDTLIFQFVVSAVGATPTVTWKVQGSDDNSNWYDLLYTTDATDTPAVSTRTATAVGAQIEFALRPYQYLRLVTTANTNVTYRGEVYLV